MADDSDTEDRNGREIGTPPDVDDSENAPDRSDVYEQSHSVPGRNDVDASRERPDRRHEEDPRREGELPSRENPPEGERWEWTGEEESDDGPSLGGILGSDTGGDEDHEEFPRPPLEPESPELENALFVLVGVVFSVLVIARLVMLLS